MVTFGRNKWLSFGNLSDHHFRRIDGGLVEALRIYDVRYRRSRGQEVNSELKLESIIKKHKSIVDWHLRDDVQRELRRDIKRELRRSVSVPSENLDEVTRTMIEVERQRIAR